MIQKGVFAVIGIVMAVLASFQLGWMVHDVSDTSTLNWPLAISEFASGGVERASPKDRVSESDIKVYKDQIVLNIANAQWSTFTDTNSMDPLLDKGANALQIVPQKVEEIQIGDIVSYQSKQVNAVIIHRVIAIGQDELGWYAIMKGDNNTSQDPERVRFEQVKRVVVGVIY